MPESETPFLDDIEGIQRRSRGEFDSDRPDGRTPEERARAARLAEERRLANIPSSSDERKRKARAMAAAGPRIGAACAAAHAMRSRRPSCCSSSPCRCLLSLSVRPPTA
jgi:hypothetical protein